MVENRAKGGSAAVSTGAIAYLEFCHEGARAEAKPQVAVIGGINAPELGRQGFADPEFANKAKNG